jgi:asparagine synthase (glutamine-hydrolysing)
MSAQFGRWNFYGAPPDPEYIAEAAEILAPYGPDGRKFYSSGGMALLYFAFHTTAESRMETQPHVSASGAIVTWDGRLDNRAELIGLLNGCASIHSPDVSIVAAAYERWGTDCFAKLIGDWALSICNPKDRTLIVAKDPIGTRHLYYTSDRDQVTWCTVLDPLVFFAGKRFRLEEEYIAGWLSFFPATHLTPYVGIHSVPPSSFVRIGFGKSTVQKYWDFDPAKRIRYPTDSEYEEHFRSALAQSVRRRLRSDSHVLAELSGGMDSSSIVCMADSIMDGRGGEAPRIDTISYYDDSEPNWNERPYFTKVEESRGRVGFHIDVASGELCGLDSESVRLAAKPDGFRNSVFSKQFARYINSQGHRVVLSGIGGDEVMGGVPTPMPELEDLFAQVRLRTLARQLKAWALNKRKPWFHLFFETVRTFIPPNLVGVPKHRQPAAWFHSDFIRRYRTALTGYPQRLKLFGPLPSLQENLSTLDALRRQLACSSLAFEPPYEKRYPYLDRDLLAFVFAIPREQLVRPGQRRSLMRRALSEIVPHVILNRQRKAFVARRPRADICRQWEKLVEASRHMATASFGFVDPQTFREALERAQCGQDAPIISLLRTLEIESWIRAVRGRNILKPDAVQLTPRRKTLARWARRQHDSAREL